MADNQLQVLNKTTNKLQKYRSSREEIYKRYLKNNYFIPLTKIKNIRIYVKYYDHSGVEYDIEPAYFDVIQDIDYDSEFIIKGKIVRTKADESNIKESIIDIME